MIQERKRRKCIFVLEILKGVVGCRFAETLRFCLCRQRFSGKGLKFGTFIFLFGATVKMQRISRFYIIFPCYRGSGNSIYPRRKPKLQSHGFAKKFTVEKGGDKAPENPEPCYRCLVQWRNVSIFPSICTSIPQRHGSTLHT